MPRGGARIGAGRPRKTPDATKLDGLPSKAKPARAKPAPLDPDTGLLDEYFDVAMKEGGSAIPTAEQLRDELLAYIKAMGAEGMVAPQLIQDYIIQRQGYLATELLNRKVGRLTSQMKISPYVQASAAYRRAMSENFTQIENAIARFGNKGEPAKENAFLALLTNKGF